MSADILVAILIVLLLISTGAVALFLFKYGGDKCSTCGTKLPRSALHCPNCGNQLFSGENTHKQLAFSYELIGLQGPQIHRRFPITSKGLTIGRNSDNDIALLGESMVSRYHAVITLEDGRCVLYDRDSANGTWVNEQRVFRHVLEANDRIQIWRSQFVFAPAGASYPLPSPPASPAQKISITGEYFDGYLLERLIGQGGMSEVYKARDPTGRTVALKILQENNPYLVDKFIQEGNTIGPLLRGHPNIVYVHKFDRSKDTRLYLVMEFVAAPSLRIMMQQVLSESVVRGILEQMCSALAFAHHNGIVHRDVKPENVLVTKEGLVKVLDFGIAKLTSASTVTRDKIVGTPEYISPEQARGESPRPASDVYSLGIVLYEMLTGSVPFRRPKIGDPYKAAMQVIRQHLKQPPEPLKERNPRIRVSANLEQVTMRALEKETKKRYETAKEMGLALGHSEVCRAPGMGARAPSASLLITKGAKRGQRISLASDSLTIGRFELDPTNSIISRRHIHITHRGGSYWLQDLSKNGTWVDNMRVYGEIPIRTGTTITVGDNVLRVQIE